MKRYSILWGTTQAGEYRYLWLTPGLPDFFGSLGATDPDKSAKTVLNSLRAFPSYSDYSEQPADDKPVTVHYAPMHLYKLPDFPSTVQPFCALSVTGPENYMRDSTYTHALVFPRELMYGSDPKFNYLDILFGSHITTWQEVKQLRVKGAAVNFDADPEKVTPIFTDLQTALYAAALILESKGEKILVLKLEKGCSFNRRAFALLKQIYSLLPPRLATETGFATYYPTENIEEHSKKNSVLIYAVPVSANPQGLRSDKTIVLDLGAPNYQPPLKETRLTRALLQWSQLSWEDRYSSYLSLFAGTETTYQDSEVFLQKSEAFLKSAQEFNDWMKAPERAGSIHSLKDIETVIRQHPMWLQIPWVKQRMKQNMDGYLLPKGITLAALLAESITTCKFLTNTSEMQAEYGRYMLGRNFGDADIPDVCNRVAEKQAALSSAKANAEFAALQAAHANELQRKTEELAALQETHSAELQKKQQEMAKQQEDSEKKIIDLRASYDAQLQAAEQETAQIAATAEKVKQAHAETTARLEEATKQVKRLEESEQKAKEAADRAIADCRVLKEERQKADDALREAADKQRRLKERLKRAEQDLADAQGDTGYGYHSTDDRPRFLQKLPWWLPLIVTLLIGALLCGAVWLTVTLLRDNDNETSAKEIVVTSSSTAPTVPTTTAPITSAPPETTAPPTTTESIVEVDPTYVFSDWSDPAASEQLLLAVPTLQTVITENIQSYCPEEWQDSCTVLAVFSVEAQIDANTNRNSENRSLTGSQNGTSENDTRDYALLVQGTVDDEALTSVRDANLLIQHADTLLLSYGSEKMTAAALQAFDRIVPPATQSSDDPTTESTTSDGILTPTTDEPVGEEVRDRIFCRVDEETLLEVTESFAEAEWWRGMRRVSNDALLLQNGQNTLNTNATPIIARETQNAFVYLYDYRENPSKIDELAALLGDNQTSVIRLSDLAGVILQKPLP